MKILNLNYQNVLNFVKEDEIFAYEKDLNNAKNALLNKTGKGNDYVGWVKYPLEYDKDEFRRIKEAAKRIRKNSDVLVVIGIGGSYLGAQAALKMLGKYFSKEKDLEIIFVGNNVSPEYVCELEAYLEKKDFSINVISKSGGTIEPAIAFRIFRKLAIKKYGKKANERIFATTDKVKGALIKMSGIEKYETFCIPSDIGGRYSVLSAVGLLPIACAGFNIDDVMQGAVDAYNYYVNKPLKENDAFLYAAIRNILYKKGKAIEILVSYEPKLHFLSEWWKQLFGESEGKENKGIFPASLIYSTDLHSMGQYVQDGQRILFETVIDVLKAKYDKILEKEDTDLDGLNYLAGKNISFVRRNALEGTVLAHVDGGVPNMILELKEITPYSFGYLVYFFMFSCGVSGYLLDVNPFNQEGVEDYKKNMLALLGKEGFEELKAKLLERINKK